MVVSSDPGRGDERGQLVLIAAILVAVTVLGTVVLLNTVHSSPNVKAQTDAQSLSDAERTTTQIQDDLETVFVATNTTDGEQYPFVEDSSYLSGNVSEYETQLVKMLSTNKSALVNITYDAGRSEEGNFSADEFDGSFDYEELMGGADSIPSLSVTTGEEVEIYVTFGPSGPSDTTISLDGKDTNDTEYEDTSGTVTDCPELSDGQLTLDFSRGSGVIRDESGGVCLVDLYEPGGVTNVSVEIDSDNSGSFAISGVDPTSTDGGTVVTDVIVNPVFEIEYIDPNVEYSGRFVLFGGDS
jgi:hypothetical protein